MHYARLRKSARLQRVLRCLRRAGQRGMTTRGLIREAHVCAVSAIAAELRAQDIPVECVQEGRHFRYRLA